MNKTMDISTLDKSTVNTDRISFTKLPGLEETDSCLTVTCEDKKENLELSESYVNTMKFKISLKRKIIFCVSLFLSIILTFSSVYFPLISFHDSNQHIDKSLNYKTVFNISNYCSKVFNIQDHLQLRVCDHLDNLVIDIREIVEEGNSIKGVQLSLSEWQSFLTCAPVIDYIIRKGSSSVPSRYKHNIQLNDILSDFSGNIQCHTRYNILNRLKLTVCGEFKEVLIDIREFSSDKPTILGIHLFYID